RNRRRARRDRARLVARRGGSDFTQSQPDGEPSRLTQSLSLIGTRTAAERGRMCGGKGRQREPALHAQAFDVEHERRQTRNRAELRARSREAITDESVHELRRPIVASSEQSTSPLNELATPRDDAAVQLDLPKFGGKPEREVTSTQRVNSGAARLDCAGVDPFAHRPTKARE